MNNSKPEQSPKQIQEEMEQEVLRQAEAVKKAAPPKDYSYFDHCKTMMHQIELDYRIAFFYTLFVTFVVCFTAMFKQRYQLFSSVSYLFGKPDNFIAIFCGGFSQIFVSLIVIVVGYLAWAHIRRCNLYLFLFYVLMTVLALVKTDWISLVLGAGGVIFYVRTLFSMVEDERISKLEGYPYFNERFELSKEDFEREPWHPDAPDRDAAYMEALTRKSLRGEQEERKPTASQALKPEPLRVEKLPELTDVICDKEVYTPKKEALPALESLSLGESAIKQSPKTELKKEEKPASAAEKQSSEKAKKPKPIPVPQKPAKDAAAKAEPTAKAAGSKPAQSAPPKKKRNNRHGKRK